MEPANQSPLGRHFLVEIFECERNSLEEIAPVRKRLLDAANQCGLTVLNDIFHQFSPYGVSGVLVLAESHLAIHTWPEHRFAAIDLFTCGSLPDESALPRVLQSAFGAQKFKSAKILRGLLDDSPLP